MNLTDIRRTAIAALFSDEILHQHLVLKGGNALELVHQVVSRGSIDIDFSIAGQFDDLDEIKRRIVDSLREKFSTRGLVVFDEKFEVVPPIVGADALPWWGGYVVEFKLIDPQKHNVSKFSLGELQRRSLPIDPMQGRTFRIDISKHEYCRDKVQADISGQTIYVYTEEMCVLEKYRAVCQQMPEFYLAVDKHPRPRGRDFYDIYAAISRRAIDLGFRRTSSFVGRYSPPNEFR